MVGSREIYEYLDRRHIRHEIVEHQPVYTMADLPQVPIPYPSGEAKNLFVRNDKKNQYYLITVQGAKRVDLKDLRRRYGTRPLSLAPEQDLQDMLGLPAGSVTPFGLLNDADATVRWFLDRALLEGDGVIGVHPNTNDATVWMHTRDLIAIIEEHGNPVDIVEI